MSTFFAGLAAFIHIYIFVMESLIWGSPRANKAFGLTPEKAEIMRPMALNQGFYNLFLAVAIIVGLFLIHAQQRVDAWLLVDYAMLSIFAAGLVLVISSPKLWTAALVQALPAVLYGLIRLIRN